MFHRKTTEGDSRTPSNAQSPISLKMQQLEESDEKIISILGAEMEQRGGGGCISVSAVILKVLTEEGS